jgi:membrane peptidoglycan carboxypeptidase
MTPPKKTILGQLTQALQSTKVNMSPLALKPNARVAEILVQDADAPQPEKYALLGEKYVLGRSSKTCDIVVHNQVVSTTHLSISKDRKNPGTFIMKDEGSTNGIYRGKKRIDRITLRHGDTFTLGPPELEAAVSISFRNPPPWYLQTLRYGLYGLSGLTSLVAAAVILEASRAPNVIPLPDSNGPVVIYSDELETALRPARTEIHTDLKNLEDFSPYLPKALVASEDSRFYWHFGIDPLGVARAVVVKEQKGKFTQGASTITQQVARSLFREYAGIKRNERGSEINPMGRKVKEAIIALKLEAFYNKDQILLAYLNRVYLGSDLINAQGFDDAARHYFGKSAKDVDLSESAMLVGILPAPARFNPCVSIEKAMERRNLVLQRMVETNAAEPEKIREARRSRLEVRSEACTPIKNTKAPYLYGYVFQELQQILGEDFAKEGNFIIETGVDLQMQEKAESALRSHIASTGKSYGFSQGGLVTMDSSTGIVKAMVGGVDYQKSQFNRATAAQRQPGSTFKLFAYAAALEQGISPNKVYSCDALQWMRSFPGCNHGAVGGANMYQGFALSENVTALRVGRDAGLPKVAEVAHRLGVNSELEEVPALVLGQSVVNVLEMTGAYGAVANGGRWNRPKVIKRIYDSGVCKDRTKPRTCREIYAYDTDRQRNKKVLGPNVTGILRDLLRGVVTNGTGKDAAIGRGEAGKTGTTDRNVDLWFIGFVPKEQLVTGIWLGNDDNSPTRGSSAQSAQLWGKYMGSILK